MRAESTIQWKPFGLKHKLYIQRALQSRMSVAEGAIRSGKTVDHCIIAAAYLETCPDEFHLVTGSTAANAKLNVGVCNGYGLESLFRGRCKWGKFKDNDCLYIQTQDGMQKVVIFAGGGLGNSYKKILGNSYGLWVATEINQHYDTDDSESSFIKVAMGRQVAAKKPMTLWDLNPSAPNHRIYTDYIDRYRDSGLPGGYNYAHFTIKDNMAIPQEQKDALRVQYGDETSLWYRRDILGERVVSEGLIYTEFADHPMNYMAAEGTKEIVSVNIGVDFGGNGSYNTFVAVGYTRDLGEVVAIMSERHPGGIDPEELNRLFGSFVLRVFRAYGKPASVYCDAAEQILIRGLRRYAESNALPCEVRNARKNPVLDRIRLLCKLMAQKRFWYMHEAATVRNAIAGAVWDAKKADTRLDDGTSDIDTMDALEYAIEPYMFELSRLS